jgi:uncharacterized LabA/DUF88 family protein
MNRTVFLLDGFNLYHSTRDASRHSGGRSTKWLDIRGLCNSYLHMVGNGAQLQDVYYFSALATHLESADPGKVHRHEAFISCLEDTGIKIEMGQFKRKRDFGCPSCGKSRCGHCGSRLKHYEEKETDVSIAAKLLELVFTDACESLVLVTGDTDLMPAFRTAKRHAPDKDIRFALPYERHNNVIRDEAPASFTIGKEAYVSHQFRDPYVLSDGTAIPKPSSW